MRYTDPLGLYCQWDDGTRDDEPSDGGVDFGGCADQGGTWIDTVSITVNGNAPDVPTDTFENGEQIFPEIFQSFGNCVKSGTDYFSLQHGLQAATGGSMGNSWVSSAFLGSSVSSAITLGQYGMNFIAPSANSPTGAQTFSNTAGEVLSDAAAPAASKLAPSVPNSHLPSQRRQVLRSKRRRPQLRSISQVASAELFRSTRLLLRERKRSTYSAR